MAAGRGHTHLIVFAQMCSYYLRAATNQGMASIRINTVYGAFTACTELVIILESIIRDEHYKAGNLRGFSLAINSLC